MDRGWSMNLSSAFLFLLFVLAIVGLEQANNQQAQEITSFERSNMSACHSIWLVAGASV